MGRVSGEGGSARSDEALGKCGGTATGRRRRLARELLLPEMRKTHQRSSGLPTRSDVSDSATTQRKRRRSHDGAGASHLPRAHPRSSLLARVCVPLVPAGSEAAVTGQKQPQLRRFVFPALLLLQRIPLSSSNFSPRPRHHAELSRGCPGATSGVDWSDLPEGILLNVLDMLFREPNGRQLVRPRGLPLSRRVASRRPFFLTRSNESAESPTR